MGFGFLFLGFMFLYDFQVGLEGSGRMIDLFPDCVGWLLILIGVIRLSRREEGFRFFRNASVLFLALSLMTGAKDLFFSSFFYREGVQIAAGETVDFCIHLMELVFMALFFGETAKLCRGRKEEKLAAAHGMVPRIALVEGVLYTVAKIPYYIALPTAWKAAFTVVSRLDFLFWVLLVWFAAISLFRCVVKLGD